MASVFGKKTPLSRKQVEKLLDITDNDRYKTLCFLELLKEYRDMLKKELLHINSMQHRKNYTAQFVKEYFYKYAAAHKKQPKMQQIRAVADKLGVTQKAIEKHLYKK